MSRRTAAATVALVLGATAFAFLWREGEPHPTPSATTSESGVRDGGRAVPESAGADAMGAADAPSIARSAPPGSTDMTRAWHSGVALRPLVDERVACARAGDRDCQFDLYFALDACAHYASPPEVADLDALERALANLGRPGEKVESVAFRKARIRACFGIGPALATELGTPNEWLHKAFASGHPTAQMVAAINVHNVSWLSSADLEKAIVASESYAAQSGPWKIPSAFLPVGTREPNALRRHAIELATTAVVDGRPEVLIMASELRTILRMAADDSPLVYAAWVKLSCEAGFPCGAESLITQQICMVAGCREPVGLLEIIQMRQGPGFPPLVTDCAQRIAAALARRDGAAALAETCT